MCKVKVTRRVLEGIKAVRDSGLTNMLDRRVVIVLARQAGFEEAAQWVETRGREYAEGIFRGFEAAGDE